MATIQEIEHCFWLMFDNFTRREFGKSHALHTWRERQLLPLVRVGLLCYFQKSVVPEAEVRTPWTRSGKSRIDFRVSNTAIEFAVRNPGKSYTNVSAKANQSELKKLMKWKEGKAVLVLFDFSDFPFTLRDLQAYRQHPSFGQGNHDKNAFTVLYYYLDPDSLEPERHLLEVRRRTRRVAA